MKGKKTAANGVSYGVIFCIFFIDDYMYIWVNFSVKYIVLSCFTTNLMIKK